MIANGKTLAQVERETEEKLASLMSKIPELRDAVQGLGAGRFCKKVFGKPTLFVDPNDIHDVSKWLLIGALAIRVDELEEKLTDIQRKAEIACAGEKNWHYAFAARGPADLREQRRRPRGDAGRRGPRDLHQDASRLPAREGQDEGHVPPGERRVARIPKSLFSVLNKVLESVPWTTLISRQVQPSNKAKE